MAWYNNLNIFLAFVKHDRLESSWKWEMYCLWNWCQFAAAVWPSIWNSNKEQDWWWFKHDCHSILLLWKCVAEPNISSFQCLVFHNEKLKLISGVLEGCDQLAGDPTTRNFGYMYISWGTLVLHTPSEQSWVWIVVVCKSLPCHFACKTLVTKLKSMLQWKQVSCFHWMSAFLPNETLPCSPIEIIIFVL